MIRRIGTGSEERVVEKGRIGNREKQERRAGTKEEREEWLLNGKKGGKNREPKKK